MTGHGRYQLLGATLDDAGGAFDKGRPYIWDCPIPVASIDKAAEHGSPTFRFLHAPGERAGRRPRLLTSASAALGTAVMRRTGQYHSTSAMPWPIWPPVPGGREFEPGRRQPAATRKHFGATAVHWPVVSTGPGLAGGDGPTAGRYGARTAGAVHRQRERDRRSGPLQLHSRPARRPRWMLDAQSATDIGEGIGYGQYGCAGKCRP